MRAALLAGIALVVTLCCLGTAPAQEPPAIDKTDPVAVAQAYVEACRAGDLKTVLDLLAPDDPIEAAVRGIVEEMATGMEQEGFTPQSFLTEFLFVPVKLEFTDELVDSQVQGDTATVKFKRTFPVDQSLVLKRAEDGTWQIRALESVKATTGREHSFLEMQTAAQSGGGSGQGIWASHNRLRTLKQGLEEYANDHDGMLPPGGTWMDEIEPYVLDRAAFRCPAAPDLEYGYAMNADASGQPMPTDWDERRQLLLLFEWPSGERNAVAMPEELVLSESFREDGAIAVIDGSGNQRVLREGMSFSELKEAEDQQNTCESHLRKFADAARRFARENGGILPGADTWQDDLALFLLDDQALDEIYTCPAAPDLDFAYAINAAIAGKNATELTGHGSIILFFESDLNVPNAAGSPVYDLPAEGRHANSWDGRRTNHIANLSGSTGSHTALTPADE